LLLFHFYEDDLHHISKIHRFHIRYLIQIDKNLIAYLSNTISYEWNIFLLFDIFFQINYLSHQNVKYNLNFRNKILSTSNNRIVYETFYIVYHTRVGKFLLKY